MHDVQDGHGELCVGQRIGLVGHHDVTRMVPSVSTSVSIRFARLLHVSRDVVVSRGFVVPHLGVDFAFGHVGGCFRDDHDHVVVHVRPSTRVLRVSIAEGRLQLSRSRRNGMRAPPPPPSPHENLRKNTGGPL